MGEPHKRPSEAPKCAECTRLRTELEAERNRVNHYMGKRNELRAIIAAWRPLVAAAVSWDEAAWCCDECRTGREGSPWDNAIADAVDGMAPEARKAVDE